VLVDAGDDHALDVIRDVLAEHRIPLRRLQPRRLSLEDVFLGLNDVEGLLAGVDR
jgi:hypothetical protein